MVDLKVPKKTFEFRMSKKVAELTQVVHMLFTRNHEKEVELDAVKESYEYEISLVLHDAKGRISALESKIVELEKRHASESAVMEQRVQQEIQKREGEWKKQLGVLENDLQAERGECLNLRDLLIQTQMDIENLRQSSLADSSSKTTELQAKDKEIIRLKKLNCDLEKRLHDQQTQKELRAQEYSASTERLTRDITQMQELLEETHRVKENVIAKNKQLEADLKSLRKDFGRKVSEIVSSKNASISVSQPASSQLDYNDEIARLKREIHKYRMELSNRDQNFNKVFTAKQPILIDPRAGKIGINQIEAVGPQRTVDTPPKTAREKSFSFAIGQAYDSDVLPPRSLSSASSSSRFPCLSQAEQRRRVQRLNKPRPLPKEFLLTKT